MAGKPQIYGTQFKTNEEGKVVPLPIENPEVGDDLRADLGLETMAERTSYMQRLQDERVNNRKNFNSGDLESNAVD